MSITSAYEEMMNEGKIEDTRLDEQLPPGKFFNKKGSQLDNIEKMLMKIIKHFKIK